MQFCHKYLKKPFFQVSRLSLQVLLNTRFSYNFLRHYAYGSLIKEKNGGSKKLPWRLRSKSV